MNIGISAGDHCNGYGQYKNSQKKRDEKYQSVLLHIKKETPCENNEEIISYFDR